MSIYKEVRRLDQHKCRAWGCGRTQNVEVHHIIPRSQGGPNEEWNLICLCPMHHRQITLNQTTDIQLLLPLRRKDDFRWASALEWHLNRQELNELKKVQNGQTKQTDVCGTGRDQQDGGGDT